VFSVRGFNDDTYTDTMGQLITQFTVTDPSGKYSGKIFSRDVIDLGRMTSLPVTEENAVVGGTKYFSGAKGSFKMQLEAMPTPPATIPVSKLNGVICADKNGLSGLLPAHCDHGPQRGARCGGPASAAIGLA
jgi:hypothetical protein